MQDTVTESEDRVPVLGAIPLLGNLFKSRSGSRQKSNLLVFLRPEDPARSAGDRGNQRLQVQRRYATRSALCTRARSGSCPARSSRQFRQYRSRQERRPSPRGTTTHRPGAATRARRRSPRRARSPRRPRSLHRRVRSRPLLRSWHLPRRSPQLRSRRPHRSRRRRPSQPFPRRRARHERRTAGAGPAAEIVVSVCETSRRAGARHHR